VITDTNNRLSVKWKNRETYPGFISDKFNQTLSLKQKQAMSTVCRCLIFVCLCNYGYQFHPVPGLLITMDHSNAPYTVSWFAQRFFQFANHDRLNQKLLQGVVRKAQSAMRHARPPWLPEAK
jgi:hypothetical protein